MIVRAVEQLPATRQRRDQAERHLVAEARHHDAKALRILGKRLLEVDRPRGRRRPRSQAPRTRRGAGSDGVPADHDRPRRRHHQRHLHAPDTARRDAGRRRCSRSPPPSTAPRPMDTSVPPPGPERMGRALCEYVERYPTDRLPDAGGLAATVVVTMTLETLMGGLKAAQLDTGARISPGAARRMACEAGIIPVVLGGKSEVLDVGRKRRFHTKACGSRWPPGRRLHRRGLRLATRAVPRPPRHPVAPGRRHQHQGRPAALPPTPRPGPRPGVHDDQAPRRQGRLHHPEDIGPYRRNHSTTTTCDLVPRLRHHAGEANPLLGKVYAHDYSAWPGTFR